MVGGRDGNEEEMERGDGDEGGEGDGGGVGDDVETRRQQRSWISGHTVISCLI